MKVSKKVKLRLVGLDGNAFALLAACKEGMAALKHYLDSVEDGKDDNAESAYQFMFVAIAAAEGN